MRATSCPLANVVANWPLIHAQLTALGQASRNSQAAAIGTTAVETASSFTPRRELYNDPPGEYAYFESMYGIGHHPQAAAMGNTQVGDGAKYFGRGFIQITWKNNYKAYGDRIGVDLVNNPNAALDPNNAANIFGLYWTDRNIQAMADRSDWAAVRAAVQGGSAGLDHLKQVVGALL